MQKRKAKKKIAFVLTTFVVGGLEKSFLDLLDCIDRDLYEVTVFLPDDKGEWTSILKEECNVQYLKIESFKTVFFSQLGDFRFFSAFRSLFYRVLSRVYKKKNYRKSAEYFIRSMTHVKEKYNCAIAYQMINDDCVLGTLYRVRADRRIAWSHSYISRKEDIYEQWYSKFDRVFCVSEFAKNKFISNYPLLTEKAEVFYNILNPSRVTNLSQQPMEFPFPENFAAIVTVGRLSKEKGQTMIPYAARLLLEAGYSIKWYLIGDGDLREDVIREIQNNHMEDHVILLGNQDNPYPYMRACKIYVQTSFVEGWGLTVSEAKILLKPIVTTNAGVMAEQIQTGVNGIIVQEDTPEALAKGISCLLDHPELCERFIQCLHQEEVCYTGQIEKLYRIID